MTAFVCDLVGSVALAQRLDVEDYADLIRAFHDYVTQWVTSFNGYVFQYAGDAVWAYFGYPHAHEDDVHRAIRAALYVASAVESLDLHDEKLRAHIGIATGLCVVGDLHYKAGAVATSAASPADGRDGARGTTPNLAARLQTTAKPGEVLIADETRSLTGALFVFEERKLSKLDGIAEPVRAWRVIRESRERSRLRALRPATLSNLVGRDDELDRLSKLWNLASKQGNGQVIHLSGEPGIGKSRLVKAVADDPTGPDHIWWFHGAPHLQGSTFAPVIAHLEEVALKKDGPLPPVEKLRRRFPMLNTDALALLAPLLSIEYNPRASVQSMSPARRRERLFEILLGLVETECVHIPLLLVTEDLHWVDPSTLELLERLGTRASDLRLMVLMTSRLARENESGASHFHRMTLSQLARDDCHALLKSLWGDRELPAKTAHQIVDRTDGVPLYIEDVTHSVLRALSQEPLDASHHHVEAQQLTVPMGLRDHLMARIDQLGDAKRIAQAGAVVGREFTRPMIETLTTTASRELDAHLDRLTDSGLVEPSGTSPVTSFKFKHAMVRDAAYESVLKADRSVLHGRMAAWLEAERPELRMSQPEVIAHHYELAGAVEPAVTCWFEAGRRSVSRVGYVEAINHLKNAHRLLLVQPQSAARDRAELDIITTLGAAHAGSGAFSGKDTGKTYERALELCKLLDYPPETFPVLSGAGSFQIMRTDFPRARKIATQSLKLAETKANPTGSVIGNRLLGAAQFLTGQFDAAIDSLQTAVSLYDADPHRHRSYPVAYALDHKTTALCYLALSTLAVGRLDTALAVSEKSLTHSQNIDQHSVNYALCYQAALRHLRGDDPDTVRDVATESRDLAVKEDYATWVGISRLCRGEAVMRLGEIDEGLAEIELGVADHARVMANTFLPFAQSVLVKGYLAAARPEKALKLLAKAEALTEQTQQIWYTPELQRLHAEALIQPNRIDEAEIWYRKALSSAQELGARFWALKIAVGLARVLLATGRREEGIELLAAADLALEEGHAVTVRVQARAFLAELRGETQG